MNVKSAIALFCLTLALTVPTPRAKADDAPTVALSTLDLSKTTQGFGKPQANLSVDRHPLMLAGVTYASGFGTHSPGLLAIQLDGGAKRFTATVGIDDETRTSGRGSAEFIVMGDGHTLWRSGILRPGNAPKSVDVDLSGIQQLVLRVTDGGDGFEFDHADWADAKFTLTVNGKRPETIALTHREPTIAMIAEPNAPHFGGAGVIGVRTGTPLFWTAPVVGVRPLRFEAAGLPKGSSIDTATGTITGIPAKAGDFAVRLRAQNAAGTDTRTVHLIVGDRVALLPPMGWNSYDYYGDTVNEAETLANAHYIHDKMQPFGWDTVVVDYRWYDPNPMPHADNGDLGETLTMDDFGRLLPAQTRFSSAGTTGFKAFADKVHAMGLRFGIHIMRGIPRNAVAANLPIEGSTFHAADAADPNDKCPWCPDMFGVRGDTPAGKAYYDSLFRLYASWGVDYVKMDDTSQPYHTREIEAVHDAIAKCGRSIVYSLSPGETPINDGPHVADHANLWRVSGDFWDNWGALNHEFTLAARWQPYVAPGHWPDADMLPIGHLSRGNRPVGKDRRTNFTHAEQMTLLSFWCLLPSPLMVGANLPDNDPWTLALLTNPEVLALDQDVSGASAKLIQSEDEMEVWSKTLADGSRAVGIFNRGDLDGNANVDVEKLGLSGRRWKVRDLWIRRDVGTLKEAFSVVIPAHGAVLYRVQPER